MSTKKTNADARRQLELARLEAAQDAIEAKIEDKSWIEDTLTEASKARAKSRAEQRTMANEAKSLRLSVGRMQDARLKATMVEAVEDLRNRIAVAELVLDRAVRLSPGSSGKGEPASGEARRSVAEKATPKKRAAAKKNATGKAAERTSGGKAKTKKEATPKPLPPAPSKAGSMAPSKRPAKPKSTATVESNAKDARNPQAGRPTTVELDVASLRTKAGDHRKALGGKLVKPTAEDITAEWEAGRKETGKLVGKVRAAVVALLSASIVRADGLGAMLRAAKKRLGHGKYGRFVRQELPFSESSAGLFVRVHEAVEHLIHHAQIGNGVPISIRGDAIRSFLAAVEPLMGLPGPKERSPKQLVGSAKASAGNALESLRKALKAAAPESEVRAVCEEIIRQVQEILDGLGDGDGGTDGGDGGRAEIGAEMTDSGPQPATGKKGRGRQYLIHTMGKMPEDGDEATEYFFSGQGAAARRNVCVLQAPNKEAARKLYLESVPDLDETSDQVHWLATPLASYIKTTFTKQKGEKRMTIARYLAKTRKSRLPTLSEHLEDLRRGRDRNT